MTKIVQHKQFCRERFDTMILKERERTFIERNMTRETLEGAKIHLGP